MSNFGSLPLPWVWNGPESVSEIGPWTCEEPPWTSIFSERSSLPESTFFSPENVCLSSSSTSVSELAELPASPPQPATTIANRAARSSEERARADRHGGEVSR